MLAHGKLPWEPTKTSGLPSFILFSRLRWKKRMEEGEELNDGVC